jgi:hypothetical protein
MLAAMDSYIAKHKSALQAYGDRLGILLRSQGSTSVASSPANESLFRKQDNKQRKGTEDKEGWMAFRLDGSEEAILRIANSTILSPTSAESAALFRATEILKERLKALESARDVIEKLPSRGLQKDQKFIVVFGEGLPRQIIPTNEKEASQTAFHYSDDFVLSTLESLDLSG